MAYLQRTAFLLALLSVSAPTILSQSAANDQKKPRTGRTAISGQVTLNGAPVAGVRVLLIPYAGSLSDRKPVAETVTDTHGNYKVEGASSVGYQVLPYDPALVLADGNDNLDGPGIYFSAGAGESVDGINFVLVPAGSIKGRILLADGNPAVGRLVFLVAADRPGGIFCPNSSIRNPERTDENGMFRFGGLSPSRYLVMATGLGTLSSNSAIFYPGGTDRGNATPISVAAGEDVMLADINITLSAPGRTYHAAGQVVDDAGKIIPHLRYELYDANEQGHLNWTRGSSSTDGSGEFAIAGLAPGKHAIQLVPDGQSSYYFPPFVYEIESADLSGLQVQARAGAVVRGVAVIEGNNDPQLLAGLPSLDLSVSSGGKEIIPVPSRPVSFTANGNFKVSGLRPGQLMFYAPPGHGLTLVRIERDGAPQKHNLSVSDGEQVTGVRLVFAPSTGVIRGQIKIEAGVLPEGITGRVVARLISGEPWAPLVSAKIDAFGHFEITGLVDGQYEISQISYPGSDARIATWQPETFTVAGGQAPDITLTVNVSKKE